MTTSRRPPFAASLSAVLALALVAGPLAAPLVAQAPLPAPRSSPRASVSQTIGVAKVTIDYHRPGVKGREIWGGVVPWDEVWRAGANENTSFEVSHPATIEGRPLPAGRYGLHVLPRRDGVTVIFSRNASSWGSYRYDPAEDALRVDVRSTDAPFAEWLTYDFEELGAAEAVCRLRWAGRAIPFRVGFDTHALVLAHARDAYLRDVAGFTWQGWSNAARYCLANDVSLAEGLAWAERSVAMSPNFTNQNLKASLLEKLGRKDEAAAARAAAMPFATEPEINTVGYQHLQAGRLDEALAMFELNARRHPESWNVWDSLAEGLALKGDRAGARLNYTKALSMVADAENRSRIEKALEELGEG